MPDARTLRLSPRMAEFATALRDAADAAARQFGLPDDGATLLANHVTRAVVADLGGQMVYVPLGYEPGLPPVYAAIWAAFTGHNHAELARANGCSVQHIYRVLAAMRAYERDERNLSLDFAGEGHCTGRLQGQHGDGKNAD